MVEEIGSDFSEESWDFDAEKYSPTVTKDPHADLGSLDRLESNIKTYPLQDRVKPLPSSDPNHPTLSTYLVDGCLRVTVPHQQLRDLMIKNWTENRSRHTKLGFSGLVITVAGGGASFFFAPIGIALAILGAIGTSGAFYKHSQARTQLNLWKSASPEKVAVERKKAYQEGFLYAYVNDLKLNPSSPKNGLLLPEEVEHLFEQYCDGFYQDLQLQPHATVNEKAEWIRQFVAYQPHSMTPLFPPRLDELRSKNPLSKNLLFYVYNTIPSHLAPLVSDYETLLETLKNIRHHFEQIEAGQRKQAREVLDEIEAKKQLALIPFNLMLSHKINEAKKERDAQFSALNDYESEQQRLIEEWFKAEFTSQLNIIANTRDAALFTPPSDAGEPEKPAPVKLLEANSRLEKERAEKKRLLSREIKEKQEAIEDKYVSKRLEYDSYYVLATTPIVEYFKGCENDVLEKLNKVVAEIRSNKQHAEIAYFPHAHRLLEQFHQVRHNQASYSPQNFGFAEVGGVSFDPRQWNSHPPDFRVAAASLAQDTGYQQFLSSGASP